MVLHNYTTDIDRQVTGSRSIYINNPLHNFEPV